MDNGLGYTERRDRLVVGVLVTNLELEIERDFMLGIAEVAERENASVIYFAGGPLRRGTPLEATPQALLENAIFDLAVSRRLDGLIISSPLGHMVPEADLRRFCDQYAPLPIVAGALGVEGLPEIQADSATGMHSVVSHLIEVHGRRRIAFVRGPEGQPEAEARYQAYVRALRDHGIPLDPELVVPGNFIRPSGEAAVVELLSRDVQMDALVAANDETAVGAYDVLVAAGFSVPHDIAVAGFDDAPLGRHLPTPLTTVRQSFREIGRRAMVTLFARIRGEAVPERLVLPAELVVRRSCGCVPTTVTRASGTFDFGEALPPEPNSAPDEEAGLRQEMSAALRAALVRDLAAGTAEFLETIEGQLADGFRRRDDLNWWQDQVSALRAEVTPGLASKREVASAEDLLHQGRVLIADMAERMLLAIAEEREEMATILRTFSADAGGLVSLEGLGALFHDSFPDLGVRRAYVTLMDAQPGAGLYDGLDRGRLVLLYEPDVVVSGEAVADSVPQPDYVVSDLLPDGVYSTGERVTSVVLPMVLRERWFGFLFLDTTVRETFVYRRIAEAVSSVLFRAQLLQDADDARRRAEMSLDEINRTREINDRLQQAPDTQAVLRIALEELSQILDAPLAVARLGTREQLLALDGNGVGRHPAQDAGSPHHNATPEGPDVAREKR